MKNVAVLLGNGDGTFQPAQHYNPQAVNWAGQPLVVGDFNGDGHVDLVSTGYNHNAAVFLGNGDGTFQPPIENAIQMTRPTLALSAGDFNGDSVLDLLSGDSNNVWVFPGNGDGTFRVGSTSAIATRLAHLSRDFDGDGDLDTLGQNGSTLFLRNRGDGSFESGPSLPTPFLATVVADFDGDGHDDLGGQVLQGTAVFLGNGDGTFRGFGDALAFARAPVAAADLDGDRIVDLLVMAAVGGLRVYPGAGDGTFTPGPAACERMGTDGMTYTVALGDFDRNDKIDVAAAGSGAAAIQLYLAH